MGGNTSGTAQISGQDIVWAGGNNVTLSANGSTVSIHGVAAQTNQTQAAGNIAGAGYTFTTQAGTSIGATHNSAGLSLAQPLFLTTARGSTDAIGLNSGLTANGVSVTANSSGLSLNFPAFLTTAANSAHSHNFATTTTNGSNIVVGTANSAGATIGVPSFLTTAALSQNTSNYAGIGTTYAGTNVNATLNVNTNGVALSLSAAGGGTINQTGPNIAVAGNTVTAGTVYFSNSPTVTFGMDGASNITASAAGGGGGATIGNLELWFPVNTAYTTLGLGTIYFQKFIPQANVSFNNIERRVSGSTVSNAASADCAYTFTYGLYSQDTGTNNTRYNLAGSSSMHIRAAFSSNTSCGITISGGGTSYVSASGGTGAMSLMSGMKHLYMPFTSTLSAGGNFAFAMNMSSATTGGTSALRLGMMDCSVVNNLTVGKLFNSTILATNASFIGDFGQGVYSSSSNALPSSIALTGFTMAVSQGRMYLQFDS